MEPVFPATGNGFSLKCYLFRRVQTDFFSSVLLFRANFVLLETIIQIKVKPFLSSLSPTIGNHFLRIFFIYNPVDGVVKILFSLTNSSFHLVESESSGNRVFFYLQLFYF